MLIHGRNGHTEGVIVVAAADMAGNIPVIGGDKVRPAAVDGLSGPGAGEPGIAGHLPGQAVVGIKGIRIHVQHGMHLNVPQLTVPHSGSESVHQCGGLGGAAVHTEHPSALQALCQFLRGGKLCLVHFLMIHTLFLPASFVIVYAPPILPPDLLPGRETQSARSPGAAGI